MSDVAYICLTCGVQHAPAGDAPPARCAICEDERQYVGHSGQRWTTAEALRRDHRADLRGLEPDLTGIGMTPSFAIGQRALLIETAQGSVLWDCVPLLTDEIVDAIDRRGGLQAIAISHPHYHATMVDWSRAFGDVPILLHAADRRWVMRPDPRIEHWDGETRIVLPGLTLIRLGGHFEGAAVLHWAAGAHGRGVLLSGDVVQVVPDRGWVSFMRSYPNLIPLPAAAVSRIASTLRPHAFERIYGAWWDRVVTADGSAAVQRSAERYVRALSDPAGTAQDGPAA